jgi:hypothetical protein
MTWAPEDRDFGRGPGSPWPIPALTCFFYASGMKAILGFISFMLIACGVTGLLHQWIDWAPRFFGFFRFIIPDGYELYGYIVLTVLGIVMAVATNAVNKH